MITPDDQIGINRMVAAAFVEQMWEQRFDTAEIASRTHLPEHQVERIVNRMMDRKKQS